MTQGNITIEFKPKGDKVLIGALKQLDIVTKRLQNTTSKYEKGVKKTTKNLKLLETRSKRNAKSMSELGLAFSTVRSKMLLFNFAMALGVTQLNRLVRESAKVQSMERGFNTLSGASENSSVALDKLKQATNGTMSEFDLFQQANNAMILGVTKNSDEMAEMFDIAQRLGKALGRDTRTSVESLITGIGRQSRLMLDNIGIITKVEEANEDYARKLGKNINLLTDSEKRQAFLNATLEAAREKVKSLGDEISSSQDVIDAYDAAMKDLGANVGKGLEKAFLPFMKAMTLISKAMTPERIRVYAIILSTVLVAAMATYVSKLKLAALWQTRLGWGALATAAGFLAGEILVMSGAFDDAEESIDLTGQQAEATAKSLMKMNLAQLIEQQLILSKIVTDSFNPWKEQKDLIDKYIKILQNGFTNINEYNDALTLSKDLYQKTPQAQKELLKAQMEMIVNLARETSWTKELNAVYGMLQEKLEKLTEERIKATGVDPEFAESMRMWGEYNGAINQVTSSFEKMKLQQIENDRQDRLSAANSIKSSRLRQREIDKINKEFDEKAKKQKEEMRDVKVAEAISNTALGITKAYSEGKWFMAALVAIQGALQIKTIQAQKYAQGGLVGGRRHSQGGTVIEAERGEYVVSRRGVDAAGLEALNRINAGQGAGGVNISINNPVLSKDVVEDDLIPQIKEAIRRGADIGVG